MISLSTVALSALSATGLYYGMKYKDPSLNVGSCFFERLAVPFFNLLREFDSNKGFMIDDVGTDYIDINTPLSRLYGLELVSGDNTVNYFNEVSKLSRDYRNETTSFFHYVILKRNGIYQKQYIFSHSKMIVENIAAQYEQPLMSGYEMVNAIFDLYLQNTYSIKDCKLYPAMGINVDDEKDNLESGYETFLKLTRQNAFNGFKDFQILQGYKALDIEKSNINELFKLNFDGVIWVYCDLNKERIEDKISSLITSAKWTGNKDFFVDLKKAYDSRKQDLVLMNTVAICKKISDGNIGTLGNTLKASFIKKEMQRKETIRKTPLKFRDSEFDYLVPIEHLENFITPVHKRIPKKPDFWGYDHNKAFTAFSIALENDAPHVVLIARTGSGKTVAKQKMIGHMIGFDYKTGYASKLGKGIKIRNYDVGYSDEVYVNLLKANKNNNIGVVESELDTFRYNLLNIEKDELGEIVEADLQFASDLVSIILESKNSVPLTLGEEAEFKTAVRDIFKKPHDYIQNFRIQGLEKTHLETYKKLIDLGYQDENYTIDIKELEFDYLKRPLLSDVIMYVQNQSSNTQLKVQSREDLKSLTSKLRNIHDLLIFSSYDNVNIKMVDFLSMDLNNFKESSLFTPILMSIFQKTYFSDRKFALECKRKGISMPKLIYAMEEAKNLFRVKSFEPMFEKVVLEARKYNVHIVFVVQNASHIPKEILKNIDTKIFLLRQDKKNEIINEVKEYFDPPQKVIDALGDTKRRELCIWYSGGVFNLTFEIEDDELKVYNTSANITSNS